jgi:hypothetical protein
VDIHKSAFCLGIDWIRLDFSPFVFIVFGMRDEDYGYRDALLEGEVHRRGAGINPGNRFESVRLHVLGEELDRQWVERVEEGTEG